MEEARKDHLVRTRSLRPIEYVNFTGHEMIGGILSGIHPDDIISLNQLHGDRRGVVRVTMTSEKAAKKLDQKVCDRRLSIKGIKVAHVAPTGQFVQVTLLDVPEYLTNSQVEKFMSYYGDIVNIKREYFEYDANKIENETRHLFFESLKREFPSKMLMYGHDVFISYRNLVKPTAIRSAPRSDNLQIHGASKPSSNQSVTEDRKSYNQNDLKSSVPEYTSSQSISPARSITPSSIVPTSSTRSSITNPRNHRVETSKNAVSNRTPKVTNSAEQQIASQVQRSDNKEKEAKSTMRKEVVPKSKTSGKYGDKGKIPCTQNVPKQKFHEKNMQQDHDNRKEPIHMHRSPDKKDYKAYHEYEKRTSVKTPPRKHKIKRSNTVEEVGSTREMEEKLALNKALESMCNPLHNFDCSEFSIKSQEGMSYGYGKLEVNPSAATSSIKTKRNEERNVGKSAKGYRSMERNVYDTEVDLISCKSRDARCNVTDGRTQKTDKLAVTDSDHKEARSLTSSPQLKEHGYDDVLEKYKKNFENTQSLVAIKDAEKQEEARSSGHVMKEATGHHAVDFSNCSLPASFSDPESCDRNQKYKDDLVRSLTATPLSITGPENRVDLNYFSSRQWFASDKTWQLSHSVRSVLSESQSSESVLEESDSANVKKMLDEVEIAGKEYVHPNDVRCTDTYVERLFGPVEKKKVRLRNTRARVRAKKEYCLFTS